MTSVGGEGGCVPGVGSSVFFSTDKINHYFEYLVRNQVQAANQQDLIVQDVNCLLYQAYSVYFTSVPSVLLKVGSMYCTMCAVCIIHGVPCEFYIKI